MGELTLHMSPYFSESMVYSQYGAASTGWTLWSAISNSRVKAACAVRKTALVCHGEHPSIDMAERCLRLKYSALRKLRPYMALPCVISSEYSCRIASM